MKPFSQRASSLKPSGIRKFFDLIAASKDIISLGVGEPDFVTPERIRNAGIKALQEGRTKYTSNAGTLECRTAISDYIDRRYGIRYNPDNEILVTVGVSEAMDLSMRALLEPGDEALIPEPCFVSYAATASLTGGTPVPVPTYHENDFRLAVEDLEKAVTPRTKVLLLSFPNNPTGAVMPKHELAKVAEFVLKHDLWVISDEIYDRLTYIGEPTCFATQPGMRERTITLNGFSKAFAMTGWRLGYACAPADIISVMYRIHQYAMMCAPTIPQYAAIEALTNADDDVEMMLRSYNERRKIIVNGFREMGLECFEPGGAFYCFPKITRTGLSSEDFAEQLIHQQKVAVVPGTAFGDCGEGHVRCCYAVAKDDIQEALRRIKVFIEPLMK